MKINYSGILGALFLILPRVVLAENSVSSNDGSILEFRGRIVESSCTIDFDKHHFTLILDKVSSVQFSTAGHELTSIDFTVDLGICTSSTRNNMSVLFQGDEDPQNPKILALREQPDAAKGLGIAIYDQNNNLIPINQPYQFSIRNDSLVNSTETFIIKYKSTALDVTKGRVNAEAKLLFVYQ
ncbi:type 1 fimbrial protein [Rosenbergiella australiborealis]|uniref:Type 1 fimbrial protein n=1 Tax=Rosenbergiella australiborealis TaxID=1544696 RepID=A0ABS5T7Z8_9GAMM|nr:fimbrial protein [Rosenbergiella australiborealis]MBT0728467.1 type 1 fimbrial protein [Rosenbergiella australiborealis]